MSGLAIDDKGKTLEFAPHDFGEFINKGNDKRWTPNPGDPLYYDEDGTTWHGAKSSYGMTKDVDIGGLGVLFGTDYPDACTMSVKVTGGDSTYSGYSVTLHKYRQVRESFAISETTTTYDYPYLGSTNALTTNTEPFNWNTSVRIEASVSQHTVDDRDSEGRIVGSHHTWGDDVTLFLHIPKSVLEASDIDGDFFGFPHHVKAGVAPEFSGGIWTLDGNFWGYPYIQSSGIAPPFTQGFSNLYLGADNVKGLYLGVHPVKRVYLGSVLVFEGG